MCPPEELLGRLFTWRTEGPASEPEPLRDLEEWVWPCDEVPPELARLSVLVGDLTLRFSPCKRRELSDCEPERDRDLLRARALEVIDSEIERMSAKDMEEIPEIRWSGLECRKNYQRVLAC